MDVSEVCLNENPDSDLLPGSFADIRIQRDLIGFQTFSVLFSKINIHARRFVIHSSLINNHFTIAKPHSTAISNPYQKCCFNKLNSGVSSEFTGVSPGVILDQCI